MNKKTISVSSYPRKDLSYLWKARGLASALGISNAYLSQLEKSIHIISSSDLLDKIAKCKNRNDFLFFYFLRSALSGTEIFYQN